jgi:Fe2+ transport system protein FeoA
MERNAELRIARVDRRPMKTAGSRRRATKLGVSKGSPLQVIQEKPMAEAESNTYCAIAGKSGTGKNLEVMTEIPSTRIEAMSWYWRFLTPVEFQRVGVVRKGPSPRC